MNVKTLSAFDALNLRFILDHPSDAIDKIETMEPETAGRFLSGLDSPIISRVLNSLTPDFAASVFSQFSDSLAGELLQDTSSNVMARVLGQMPGEEQDRYLSAVPPGIQKEYKRLMSYPLHSAGRLMDTHIHVFRDSMTVKQAMRRLRQPGIRTTRALYLVDAKNILVSEMNVQDLVLADYNKFLKEYARPVRAVLQPEDPREEVVHKLEEFNLTSLPVVDLSGQLIGIVRHETLIKAAGEEATIDIQTMFGVSADERALSKPRLAVRNRLPWLQINLLTAFLASAVVGSFEGIIAKFTALAVLLPVVAGQSGNAGAQALAVTMRGLALREISVRQWGHVVRKEIWVGLVNGIAIAATTALGVYFWSRSLGLALVIAISMVMSMIAAGIAGASVPIVLTRLGQDPATASSIILTTVTDVAGFFSFLGIATLLSNFL